MELEFEWNDAKAQLNESKHGVTFGSAREIFLDPLAAIMADPRHSLNEDRFLTIGTCSNGELIVVSHTFRENRIRIISARRATASERMSYELRG